MMSTLSITDKTPARISRWWICWMSGWGLAGTLSCLAAQSDAPHTTKSSVPEVVVSRSIFNNEIGRGCDPFFPHSTRRQPKAAANDSKAAKKAPAIMEVLSVRGIIAAKEDRRLALINGRVFAQGETFEISIPDGRMRIRCLEIKPSSVVLAVEGGPERYELHMRKD